MTKLTELNSNKIASEDEVKKWCSLGLVPESMPAEIKAGIRKSINDRFNLAMHTVDGLRAQGLLK